MSLTDHLGRYTCSSCGAREPWGETWRWKIADEFTNDVRRLLTFCHPACPGTYQQVERDRQAAAR